VLTELLELRLQRLVQGGLVPRPTAASRRRRSCLDTHLAGMGGVTLGPGGGKVAAALCAQDGTLKMKFIF